VRSIDKSYISVYNIKQFNIQTVDAEKRRIRAFQASGLWCEFHKSPLRNMDCEGLRGNSQTRDLRQESGACQSFAERTGNRESRWYRGYRILFVLDRMSLFCRGFFLFRRARQVLRAPLLRKRCGARGVAFRAARHCGRSSTKGRFLCFVSASDGGSLRRSICNKSLKTHASKRRTL